MESVWRHLESKMDAPEYKSCITASVDVFLFYHPYFCKMKQEPQKTNFNFIDYFLLSTACCCFIPVSNFSHKAVQLCFASATCG